MQRRKILKPRIQVSWLSGTRSEVRTATFTGWNASGKARDFKAQLAWRRGVHSIQSRRIGDKI